MSITVKQFTFRKFEIELIETEHGNYTIKQTFNNSVTKVENLTDLRIALDIFDSKLESFLELTA